MRLVLIIAYAVFFILSQQIYMHMFQLNSYSFKKQLLWIKQNKRKVVCQVIPSILSGILFMANIKICEVFALVILFFGIAINIPKNKSKVPLKYTNRVVRMYMTILLIAGFVCFLVRDCVITLWILNIFSILLIIIANYINYPIETISKKRYIYKAKKILKNMPNLLVIGVTGSYGKTSVKNYLSELLSLKYNVLVTPQNYNTPMGIVKTIREELKPIHEVFVCEMGAVKLGEIKEICDIVNPKIGVITAVGPQHLETFKTIDNIVKTKFELADAVNKNNGITFINSDIDLITDVSNKYNIRRYGVEADNNNYFACNLESSSKGLEFNFVDSVNKTNGEYKTKLIGKHNVINLTGALSVANYLGVDTLKMQKKIREIKSVKHRLELIPGERITIIDDSYNSNPVSSKSALDTLSEFDGVKAIVTPGLIELGNDERIYNFEFGKYIAKVCDYIYIVKSKVSKYVLEGIEDSKIDKNKVFIVDSPQEAISKVNGMNKKITVLIENDLPDNYNV